MNKFFLYLLLLTLSSCGLGDKEIETQNQNSKIIFEKSKPIIKELNSDLKIKLNKLTKGEVFLANNTNNIVNINFETDLKTFNSINPCGLDVEACNLIDYIDIDKQELLKKLLQGFKKVIN